MFVLRVPEFDTGRWASTPAVVSGLWAGTNTTSQHLCYQSFFGCYGSLKHFDRVEYFTGMCCLVCNCNLGNRISSKSNMEGCT